MEENKAIKQEEALGRSKWQGIHASKYLFSMLPALISIGGNLLGGYFTLGNIIFTFGLLALADLWFAEDKKDNIAIDDTLPDAILLLATSLHTLCVGSLLYGIQADILTGKFVILAAISTGLCSGSLGSDSAHELVHRKKHWMQHLGIWNLFLVNYSHFYTEHRLVHHVKVGTSEDPATARLGETLYGFWLRTIPSQWYSALQTDARIQRKKERFLYGLHNFTVRMSLLQFVFILMLYILLGSIAVLAYLIQSLVAFMLLEYINYIEHYGLMRTAEERVGKAHAWQSDALTSRFTLFELSRHPDHHIKASKPYHTLQSHQESPQLPFGYYGMFYLAIIPPLFFHVMHKRMPGTAL